MISVIVPIYNAERYVKRCVENIQKQDIEKEIILIDDGSKDGSSSKCDLMAEKYDNIKVIHTENKGVSNARNIGLEQASGEFITFVDVDDLLKDDMLKVLYKDLIENEADISCIGYEEVYVNTDKRIKKFGTNNFYVWSEPLKEFLTDNKISWMVWGKLYRREIVNEIRFPVGKAIAEDMYFVFQACTNAQKVSYRDESFYEYMIHPESALRQSISEKDFDTPKLVEQVYNDVLNKMPEYGFEANAFRLRYSIWFYRSINIKAKDDIRFKSQILEIRDIIISYTIDFAYKSQTKKYFFEWVIVKYSKRMYSKLLNVNR